jgi:transcriptional regulator with XRE-family HTH domain
MQTMDLDEKSKAAPFSGAALRRLRELAGLSRADIAERLGLPHAGIVAAWEEYDWSTPELSHYQPTASDLLALAALLRVAPGELSEEAESRALERRRAVSDADIDADDQRALVVELRTTVLHDRRTRRGLSVEEVGARARVDAALVSCMEDEVAIGSLDELVRVLGVLFEDPIRALAEVLSVRAVGPASFVPEDPAIAARIDRQTGEPLRQLREERGLTREDVAARAEIDLGVVCEIENVRVGSVRSGDLADYLDAIGVPLDEGFRLAGLRSDAAEVSG